MIGSYLRLKVAEDICMYNEDQRTQVDVFPPYDPADIGD